MMTRESSPSRFSVANRPGPVQYLVSNGCCFIGSQVGTACSVEKLTSKPCSQGGENTFGSRPPRRPSLMSLVRVPRCHLPKCAVAYPRARNDSATVCSESGSRPTLALKIP
jgi:hypothetical protein